MERRPSPDHSPQQLAIPNLYYQQPSLFEEQESRETPRRLVSSEIINSALAVDFFTIRRSD